MPDQVSEKRVERALRDGVEGLGGMAIKLMPTIIGIPDRLVILPGGRIWFVELKAPGKRITKVQGVIHQQLRSLGCNVVVIDTPDGVKRWTAGVQHPSQGDM